MYERMSNLSFQREKLDSPNLYTRGIKHHFLNNMFFLFQVCCLSFILELMEHSHFLQIKEKYLMHSKYGLEYAWNLMDIVAQTIIPSKKCYRKHVKLIESMIRLFCSIHFVMSNVGKPIMYLDIWKTFKNKGMHFKPSLRFLSFC